MKIPDGTPDEELDAYRDIVIGLWRTSSGNLGGWGAEPAATLIALGDPCTIVDPVTGYEVEQLHRAWHIDGSVS